MHRYLILRKDSILVRKLISKGQYDLPFGLYPTAFPSLNPINGQRRNACFTGKLRLTHELFFSNLFSKIKSQFILQFLLTINYLEYGIVIYNYQESCQIKESGYSDFLQKFQVIDSY